LNDLTPLDIDRSGNGSRIRTLEFDEADAAMLAYAVSVAAGTAMMSRSPEAVRRLQHYKTLLREIAPPEAKLLDRETDLCEIVIASGRAASWTIHRIREREWSSSFRAVITVDDRIFTSSSLIGEADFGRILGMLEGIVPMTCPRVERADEIGSPWIGSR
jgi:hypothetical protein